jgi:hypothetical protein
VEYHLERGLRLHTDPEYKSLYSWAINEIDAEGRQVGGDQIPWRWTLRFTATSCELSDSVDIGSSLLFGEAPPARPEVTKRQVIHAQLRPGTPSDDEHLRWTTLSMFGTGRIIKSFMLQVQPLADPIGQERCTAWGTVSNTGEIDFQDMTDDDCIVFNLFVKPETFVGYAAKVAHGLVDNVFLSVGAVDGFYSDWSPSASASQVKVLTRGGEQAITLPPGHETEPPRLGHVGKATLQINRRLVFGKRAPEPEAAVEMSDLGIASQIPALAGLPMLDSLRRAVWLVVLLLALILGAMLLRR